MEIGRFERFINSKRKGFRKMLERNGYAKRNNLAGFIKAAYDECGSEFEEVTLVENFREEFQDFVLRTTGRTA